MQLPKLKEFFFFRFFISISLFSFFNANTVKSQEVNFSQLYAAPLFFNPAFASLDNKIEAGFNHRNQLFNNQYNYSATQFSFIYPIIIQRQDEDEMLVNHRGAVGISAFNESVGVQNKLQVNGGLLTVAYNLHLDKEKTTRIAIGAQGGYVQRSLDFETLKWGSQYENLRFNLEKNVNVDAKNTINYPVVNVGATLIKRKHKVPSDSTSVDRFMYIGFSSLYLNAPAIDYVNKNTTQKLLLRGQAGIDFLIGERMLLSPHAMFQSQNGINQLFGGLYYYYFLKKSEDNERLITLLSGVWYRQSDALVGMLGMQLKKYTLGVSYDYRLSGINQGTESADIIEFSFKLRFGIKKKKASKKASKKNADDKYKPMLIL